MLGGRFPGQHVAGPPEGHGGQPPQAPGCPPSVEVPQVILKAGGDAICTGAPSHSILSPERGVALFSLGGDITCPMGNAAGWGGRRPKSL